MALEADPTNNTGDLSKYAGTLFGKLFGNSYIHDWLLRHMHLLPDRLIACLGQAVEVSRAEDRGLTLPEVPRKAAANAGTSGHFPKSPAWPPSADRQPS